MQCDSAITNTFSGSSGLKFKFILTVFDGILLIEQEYIFLDDFGSSFHILSSAESQRYSKIEFSTFHFMPSDVSLMCNIF